MSNDGLTVQDMDLSHIHLAVNNPCFQTQFELINLLTATKYKASV